MNWRGRLIALVSTLAVITVALVIGLVCTGETFAGKPDGIIILLALVLAAFMAGILYDRGGLFNGQGSSRLKASKMNQYGKMLDQLPDSVFLFGREELLFCNYAAEQLWGEGGKDGIAYSQFLDRIHPDDRNRVPTHFYPHGESAYCRTEVRFKGPGDQRYMEFDLLLSTLEGCGEPALQIILHDLTEQKRVQRKLELAETESRYILQYQQGITFKYVQGEEGQFIYTLWAGELADEVGLPPENVVGKSPLQIFSPEIAQDMLHYYRLAWEEGKAVIFEMTLGQTVCMVVLRPLGYKGRQKEVVGYCSDISQRKETEAELIRTKEMLESFFNNTSDAIDVTDLNGRIMHINQAFADMFGWPYEECIGQSALEVVPPELHEEMKNFHEAVEFGGHISGYETKRVRKSGEEFDVSVTISPIRSTSGGTVAIAAISRDITESKQVEAALRKSETKYRLIAENMTDVVGVLNYQGLIEYISPSSRMMLGVEPEELIGFSVFDWMHPEDTSQVAQFFKRSLTVGLGDVAELRMKHIEGHWVVLEVSSRWMPDLDQGNLPNILMVARDITERKKAEEMLLKSEKLSVVGQLAAGVAHEIRNPLTSLKGFLQLLQKRSTENGFFFELMLSELDRINNIVSEFLVLSKPQAVKMERRNLVQIVQVVVSFLGSQALLNNVQIVTCIQTGPEVIINCDENQLKQVFINLLKNAVEAMPGGGTITVTLLQSGKDKVLVRFQDEGQGIPEDRLLKLGEPFYTTKEKGTGLGLMVSFRIIEDHGGMIRVTSEVGIGSIFDVELPLE